MRKLIGLLLSGIAFASELPDFREHAKEYHYTGSHFRIIAVDERRSVSPFTGYREVAYPGRKHLGYCQKYGFPIFTKVVVGGMEVEKEYPKNIGLWGLATNRDADFHEEGYCKDKDGRVIVRYKGYVIEHPPSKIGDILPKVIEEKIKDVRTFEDMLRVFKAKEVERGSGVYRIEGSYGWIGIDENFTPFVGLVLCRRMGGELYKITGGNEVRFAEYLWEIHSKVDSIPRSPFFNPDEERVVSQIRSDRYVNRFSGVYLCRGGKQEWTLSYSPYTTRLAGIAHVSILRQGIDQALVERTKTAQLAKLGQTQQGQPQQVVQAPQTIETLIARQTATAKSPVVLQQGNMRYEGRYNGEQGGCSLVSVLVYVGQHQQATHNYRVCGERIEYVGETGIPALPKGIESVRLDVARLCQKYGTASLQYENTTLNCRALRDRDKCLVEISYLQGGRLVRTETLNGCQ